MWEHKLGQFYELNREFDKIFIIKKVTLMISVLGLC